MKSYMVFECAEHRFTWAGGCIIFVNIILSSGASGHCDTIECYNAAITNKDVEGMCLDWLEEHGYIEEAELYLSH